MLEKLLIFLAFSVVITKTAYAYLDPGTGSMLFQLISALLLTGVFTMKIWAKAIKSFLTRKSKDTKNNDEQQNPR
jgi:hypothetical protein